MWIQFEAMLCEFHEEHKQALLGVFASFWLFHKLFAFIELTHPILGFVEYFIDEE